MSESNKWFRDKWNRLDKLKHIEDNWFDVFNENVRSEEHTSELQSLAYIVCRLLLEKKNIMNTKRGVRGADV